MYHGISILQPVHQVAQKSSRTTWPLYADNVIGFPLASFSVKSGAATRSAVGVSVDSALGHGTHGMTMNATTNAIRAKKRCRMAAPTGGTRLAYPRSRESERTLSRRAAARRRGR